MNALLDDFATGHPATTISDDVVLLAVRVPGA